MQKRFFILSICSIAFVLQADQPPLIEKVIGPKLSTEWEILPAIPPTHEQPRAPETSEPMPQEKITPTSTEAQERTADILNSQEADNRDLRGSYKQSAIMQNIRKLTNVIIRNESTGHVPMAFSFSGYVKQDTFVDSRQVDGERQDHFLLFPKRYLPDTCYRDINKQGRFNMVSIETRARGEAAGPIIFGARSFGAMEADFWGGYQDFIGIFRLRHAFLYLVWPDKNLLLGQYWHPIFLPECYPDTISFNNGVPIEAYSRQPQIRFTKTFDNITIMFAATSYATILYDQGEAGYPDATSNLAERNAIMPDLNLQAKATFKEHFCGIGINCRRIIPHLVTTPLTPTQGRRTKSDLFSFLGLAYAKFNWNNVTCAMKLIFAQNGLLYEMISGYATHCIDPLTQSKSYANLQCVSFWVDFARKGIWEPGLFLGISKNLGASTTIIPSTAYALGREDIDYIARIQPRLRWFIDPFIFGGEFEITRTAWGVINDRGRVQDVIPVTNYRALFAAFFCF